MSLAMSLPSRNEQIILSHAAFICQVVEFSQNPERGPELDKLLNSARENGWEGLVAAIRKILQGQRELSLIRGLDEEDQVIAESILRGLQDPSTLPDPAQQASPTLAAPGLAHMIHAAATGNAQALILISNMAEQMSKAGGAMARLAGMVRPMINGERDADKLCSNMDAQTSRLVLGILEELGKLDHH